MRTLAAPGVAGVLAFLTAFALPADDPPDPYTIQLLPTPAARRAEGRVRMSLAAAPFGVAVTPGGRHVFRLDLRASNLPRRRGGAWIAWAADPDLSAFHRLGEVDPDAPLTAHVDLDKFLVLVSWESDPAAATRSGPIALRGVSPSGFLTSMAGHDLFSGGMPH